MKILVTGSSGFLGGAIRRYLINKGYDTYGTTRSRAPKDSKEFLFDITRDSCHKKFKNITFDVIIHTIGLMNDNARFTLLKEVNVVGTSKIVEYAKTTNCKHLIHLSSVSVYGIKTLGQNRTEKSVRIRPHLVISKYAKSKAQAELKVLESGLPITVLRLPLMIGDGDEMITPNLVDLLQKNQIFYLGNGEKLVSVMPVTNLCFLISILVKKDSINHFLHAPSYHIPLNTFVKKHSLLTGLPLKIKKAPFQFFFFKKMTNIQKILFYYSLGGAHFQDLKIRSLIPEYQDVITWDSAIQNRIKQISVD